MTELVHSPTGVSTVVQQREAGGRAVPVDGVCGVTVSKEEARATASYKGRTYYFCSAACRDAFVRNPDYYREGLIEEEEPKGG
jgi:YHS domain-containing protein